MRDNLGSNRVMLCSELHSCIVRLHVCIIHARIHAWKTLHRAFGIECLTAFYTLFSFFHESIMTEGGNGHIPNAHHALYMVLISPRTVTCNLSFSTCNLSFSTCNLSFSTCNLSFSTCNLCFSSVKNARAISREYFYCSANQPPK